MAPLFLLLVAGAPAAAATDDVILELEYAGTASGALGGLAFADADFVITGSLDTRDWAPLNTSDPFQSVFVAPHSEASIWIEGIGSYDFFTSTGAFVNQTAGLLGLLQLDGGSNADLYHGPLDQQLRTWDRTSSLAPLDGHGRLLQWGINSVLTSGGELQLNDAVPTPVFVSVAALAPAPEPAAWLLAAIGGVAAGPRRRREPC